MLAEEGVAVIVNVEIKAERLEEFLQVMKIDVEGSRLEEGNIRFDFLQKDETNFTFYEVYKSEAAMAFHKETSHYGAWAAFKASGGVISQTVELRKFCSFL